MLKNHGDAVLLCLTAEAGERALNSTWNEEKGCAVSADDKELEEINKKDNMTWLIETKESKGEMSKEVENMENFQKNLDEKNNRSHFDFNKIMEDSSVASLLNP